MALEKSTWTSRLIFCTVLAVIPNSAAHNQQKICIGTSHRLWYDAFKERYTNCTLIVGNLRIFQIGLPAHSNLDFLKDLEEITGYLFIQESNSRNISLPKLRIIRGDSLLRINPVDPEYALVVDESPHLFQVLLPSLREISKGSVGIFRGKGRKQLCFTKTIDWTDIVNDKDAQFPEINRILGLKTGCSKECHSSCESGCWGEGENECQQLSKQNCSAECGGGRCFGATPEECCHPLCAAGCTGPNSTECLSCKHVKYDGECKESCPNNMYSLGPTCVDSCPDGSLIDEEVKACVSQCPIDKHQESGNICKKLPSTSKKCRTLSDMWPEVFAKDIEYFRNCTVLEGDIRLVDPGKYTKTQNFTFSSREDAPSTADFNVFSTLREITGSIYISNTKFPDLSCFQNLEVIGGDLDIYQTQLESWNFNSLRIIHGDVHINRNKILCNVGGINWSKLRGGRNNSNVNHNRKAKQCKNDGKDCSVNCAKNGCWGNGFKDCVCLARKEECVFTCNVNKEPVFRDGNRCVKVCPTGKYPSKGNCTDCHEHCKGECTGHGAHVGDSGCSTCHQALLREDDTLVCMKNHEKCPADHYLATTELPHQATQLGITHVCVRFPTKIPNLLWIFTAILIFLVVVLLAMLCYRNINFSKKSISWACAPHKSLHSRFIDDANDQVEFGRINGTDW